MLASSSSMPTWLWLAISFSAVARPPRVGSRSTRICGQTASMAATSPPSGAQSLARLVVSPNCSRSSRIVAPWSPSVPLTITTSPGLALVPQMSTPGGISPIPAVLMNSLSAAPWLTTLVSPVTTSTPASRAASAIDRTTVSNSDSGSPSSMMKPQLRYSGRAPLIARSLTVPQTASLPMLPPGNSSGLIT